MPQNKQREINGKLICLQSKYGKDAGLFDTYENTLKLVEKYPIVYTAIPERFKDKNMTLTYIRANGKWIALYKEMLNKELSEDEDNHKNHTILARNKGRFAELTNNAVVDGLIDFGELTKDADVLVAAMENDCCGEWSLHSVGRFELTESNYDEKTFIKAIERFPEIITRVYDYWVNNIKNYPKVIESISRKFELYYTPEISELSFSELAFYKCYNMIKVNNKKAVMMLFVSVGTDFDVQMSLDHIKIMKKFFSAINGETQNYLVCNYFYYAKYVRKSMLEKEIQDEIVRTCPIAGDILSDEAILKYNLMQSSSDKEAEEKCKECLRCQFVRAKIV